jgi:hypothetical protein
MSQPLMIVNFGTINMNGDIHINSEESGISALREIQAAAARATAAADDLEKTPWVAASLNAEKEEVAAKAAKAAEEARRERLKRALRQLPPSREDVVKIVREWQQETGKNKIKTEDIYSRVRTNFKEWWDSISNPKNAIRDTLQQSVLERGWIDGKSYMGKGVEGTEGTVFKDLKAHRNEKCIWRVKKGYYTVMTPDELASLRINYNSDKLNEYITITLGNDSSSYKKTKSIVSKI